jgi:ATP-dependent DNA ligase
MLRPDGPYEFGETTHATQKRSQFLWKHKQWEDGEFMIHDVTMGEGKASIGIGAFVLKNADGTDLFNRWGKRPNVGTGFSDEERIIFAKSPPIGQMVRVRYPYLSEDGVPQCPSFVAVMSE